MNPGFLRNLKPNESMEYEEDSDFRMAAGADAQDANKGQITPPSKEDIVETQAVEGRYDQLHDLSRTDLSEDGGDDRFFDDAEEHSDVAELETLLDEDDLEDEAVLGGIRFLEERKEACRVEKGRDGSIHIQTKRDRKSRFLRREEKSISKEEKIWFPLLRGDLQPLL